MSREKKAKQDSKKKPWLWIVLAAALLLGAFLLWQGRPQHTHSVAIIGGADGPTAIFVTGRLAS